jgi:2-isopropylmalate synthase
MFSPEAFSASDTLYCLRLCEAAKSVWEPTVEIPIILTLPATMEMSTPNVYADQVELFATSISDREKVCVSLHVHNDRGCAVAAAELGQMAGAERVEGCLFGNGERAGNVDLVTLALNLYSQGLDPGVDFSNIASVRAFVEGITDIKLHPRTPYAGDLYFTAYSGAHQDAISKGLSKFNKAASVKGQQPLWEVPYLSMDPADLGSSHDNIIRLNSQSGKGGVAWTLFQELHVQVPKGLQLDFSKAVKRASEMAGGIISPPDVANLFVKQYFLSDPDPRIIAATVEELGGSEIYVNATNGKRDAFNSVSDGTVVQAVESLVRFQGREQTLRGEGSSVTNALSNALAEASIGDVTFKVSECNNKSASGGLDTLVFVECQSPYSEQPSWGVRRLRDHGVSVLLAALSAILVLFPHLYYIYTSN